ncbi:hypothetical protein CEP54_014625 [Fusarium duplospermum]|uniref:Uncharacterized protein n=1 Tax=Fusarium duplospermum TaxID=1325734 RepID=A0A428NV23_9HYPO|nr:hypothetical protein CEP54_014625 [Fusarium duplospermum]
MPAQRILLTGLDIPFIEPCGVCLNVYTSCHQAIKHKCQQSPSITEWTEKRSKEWSEERTRRLKIRISQEYDCAINACAESIFHEEVKAKRKISEAPEPTRLDWVDTSNAGPSITNNAPALPDTYADNNELPEDHRIATQLNMRVSAEGNAGTNDATLLTGEIAPGTGHFCMDDARTLETAHDFGFFCLDDMETRVATTWDAGILDQNVWDQVNLQDLCTRGRDMGNRKRPPSMIS